jgi:hypothetical protein
LTAIPAGITGRSDAPWAANQFATRQAAIHSTAQPAQSTHVLSQVAWPQPMAFEPLAPEPTGRSGHGRLNPRPAVNSRRSRLPRVRHVRRSSG